MTFKNNTEKWLHQQSKRYIVEKWRTNRTTSLQFRCKNIVISQFHWLVHNNPFCPKKKGSDHVCRVWNRHALVIEPPSVNNTSNGENKSNTKQCPFRECRALLESSGFEVCALKFNFQVQFFWFGIAEELAQHLSSSKWATAAQGLGFGVAIRGVRTIMFWVWSLDLGFVGWGLRCRLGL